MGLYIISLMNPSHIVDQHDFVRYVTVTTINCPREKKETIGHSNTKNKCLCTYYYYNVSIVY